MYTSVVNLSLTTTSPASVFKLIYGSVTHNHCFAGVTDGKEQKGLTKKRLLCRIFFFFFFNDIITIVYICYVILKIVQPLSLIKSAGNIIVIMKLTQYPSICEV